MLFSVEPATHLRFVILDVCCDNPFAKKMKRTVATRVGAVSRGLVRLDATRPNTLIAVVAKEVATAADGANRPFTTALLKRLTRRA